MTNYAEQAEQNHFKGPRNDLTEGGMAVIRVLASNEGTYNSMLLAARLQLDDWSSEPFDSLSDKEKAAVYDLIDTAALSFRERNPSMVPTNDELFRAGFIKELGRVMEEVRNLDTDKDKGGQRGL